MASYPDENHPAKNPTLESNQYEEQPDQNFISQLPDEILHLILSKLEIRDAAVTTALSNRWAPLFPTMLSLTIVNSSFIPRYTSYDLQLYGDKILHCLEWLDALFSVLDSRIGPIKNFDIAVDILDRCDDHFYEVFRYVCAAGVEELSIRDFYNRSLYKIPLPVFACKTITKLEIGFCNLVVPSKLTGLQAVKLLDLYHVKVSDDHLRRIISRCTAMEKLEISDCYKVKNIVIHAPNLLVLKIGHFRPVGIVLKSAPRLDSVSVSFHYYEYGFLKFQCGPFEDKETDDEEEDFVEYNPNSNKTFEGANVVANLISFLNRLRGIKDLRLTFNDEYRRTVSKEGIALPTRLKFYLVKLKKLCLSFPINYHTFNMIISCLLNSSPHLTEIIIRVDTWFYDYKLGSDALELNFWEKQQPADCVINHLTTATFYFDDYISVDCFAFPKFLLLNAGNLKKMNMLFYNRKPEAISKTEEKIKNEMLAIQMVSQDVEIMIKPVSRMHIPCFESLFCQSFI